MAGLDGLRAVAVLAVIAYHSGLGWLPGGFLGVDLFFVLSGYLITTLLIREWEKGARIDLVAFWARRARRLLPALLLVIIAVAVYGATVADPVGLQGLRFDTLATLGQVANWRFISSHQSYFESFAAPSPLRHMWSLAVEAQWYLLWPWVMAAAMGRWAGRTAPMVGVIAVAGAVSAATMAALHAPLEDPSRAYFGTDTRAHTLLVGSALAFVLRRGGWAEGPALRRAARWWRITAHSGGTVALAAIGVSFLAVHDSDAVLYDGGFLLFAFGGALVIGAAVAPGPNLVKVMLAPRALQAVGRISYGLYLWHWPVNVVLVPDRVGTTGVALAGLRTAVTFACASASFVLVERPVRLGWLRLPRPAWVGAGAVVATALVVVAATVGPSTVATPANAMSLSAEPSQPGSARSAQPQTRAASAGAATSSRDLPPVSSPTTATSEPPRPVNALLVGDSIAFTLGIGFQPMGKPSTSTCRPSSVAVRWRAGA
ncbi:MAG: acyltransferase [Acidimicrobiales bacterium]